jgi:hypothetical protein
MILFEFLSVFVQEVFLRGRKAFVAYPIAR